MIFLQIQTDFLGCTFCRLLRDDAQITEDSGGGWANPCLIFHGMLPPNRTGKGQLTMFLVLLWQSSFVAASNDATAELDSLCPMQCQCDIALLEATCSGAGLVTVPLNLPPVYSTWIYPTIPSLILIFSYLIS